MSHISMAESNRIFIENPVVVLQRNEFLYRKEEKPRGVWVVCRGHIKVCCQNLRKPLITQFITPGGLLGCGEFLSGRDYHCCAQAVHKTQVIFIEGYMFRDLLQRNVAFTAFMLRRLAVDLERAENLATQMAYGDARQRVLEVLFGFHEKRRGEGDPSNNYRFRRRDLAEMAGLTPDSTCRVLHGLEKEGLLVNRGLELEIIDVDKFVKTFERETSFVM